MHLSGADDARSGPELAIAIAWLQHSRMTSSSVSLGTTSERPDWFVARFRIARAERKSA